MADIFNFTEIKSGLIELPRDLSFTPSEFIPIGELDFLVTFLAKTLDGSSVPILFVKYNPEHGFINYRVNENHSLPQAIHARNATWYYDQFGDKHIIVTDHGHDKPPFPGGCAKHFILKDDTVIELQSIGSDAFYFDVTSLALPGFQERCVLLTNLSSGRGQCALVSSDGTHRFADEIWPMSGEFFQQNISLCAVDLDGDGVDEVIVGARGGRNRDLIFKWNGSKFVESDYTLPEKYYSDWETICVSGVDLHNSKQIDILTLNHSKEIDQGSIEFYQSRLESGKLSFFRQSASNALIDLYKVKNQWFHRAQSVDVNGDGNLEILLLTRRVEYPSSLEHDRFYIIQNKNGVLENSTVSGIALKAEWLGFYVGKFLNNDSQQLLLIDFKGRWKLFQEGAQL